MGAPLTSPIARIPFHDMAVATTGELMRKLGIERAAHRGRE